MLDCRGKREAGLKREHVGGGSHKAAAVVAGTQYGQAAAVQAAVGRHAHLVDEDVLGAVVRDDEPEKITTPNHNATF